MARRQSMWMYGGGNIACRPVCLFAACYALLCVTCVAVSQLLILQSVASVVRLVQRVVHCRSRSVPNDCVPLSNTGGHRADRTPLAPHTINESNYPSRLSSCPQHSQPSVHHSSIVLSTSTWLSLGGGSQQLAQSQLPLSALSYLTHSIAFSPPLFSDCSSYQRITSPAIRHA